MGLTLTETAALLGRLRYIELLGFELLGSWVPITSHINAKNLLAEQCQHHAWHAELLGDRFPGAYVFDLERSVQLAEQALSGVAAALSGASTTIARLAGWYRVVVPAKIAVYHRWLTVANPVAESPVQRSLRLVLHDESADWQAGETLLRDLVGSSGDLQEAFAQQIRVETALLDCGNLAGSIDLSNVQAFRVWAS